MIARQAPVARSCPRGVRIVKRLLTCVLVVGCCVALASDIPPPRPKVDVAALVRQLGSEDFNEREEASRQLAALPVDEPPAELLAALKSSNPEVRDRAAKAAKAIREAAARRRLPRDERFATRGQVDLYVASTAALDQALKDTDERLWVPAFDLGAKVAASADTTGDRKPGCPSTAKDFPTYCSFSKPKFFRLTAVSLTGERNAASEPIEGYHQVIQAGNVDAAKSINGLVVSRGPVRAKMNINSSLILATGDVTAEHNISGSIVVCDGDVSAGKYLSQSVVIARGNITVKGAASSCTLIAGGSVTVGKLPDPVARGEDPKDAHRRRAEIREKDSNPLGFITFFELRRIGLDVKTADGAVLVASVAAGNVCDKAGLKVGDTVLEVNGKKPSDAESLRRLLRDALAAVGEATVKLRRGQDTVTAKLAISD
jgi:hypothetical protein